MKPCDASIVNPSHQPYYHHTLPFYPSGCGEKKNLSLGRSGSLEIMLASTEYDIRQAQTLRHKVFFEERLMLQAPVLNALFTSVDSDSFDEICDHLIVKDHHLPQGSQVVGTYRLLRQDIAQHHQGFYTNREFDIVPLIDMHPHLRFLELGRSCVLKAYRGKRVVELLWAGIWAYVRQHQCDVMLGCASFQGFNADELALPLSFLHHYASALPQWQASAWNKNRLEFNMISKDQIDTKAALQCLPPLIKGYLRLGASFGCGAVTDADFNTTDVLVVMPVSQLNPRYVTYFTPVQAYS